MSVYVCVGVALMGLYCITPINGRVVAWVTKSGFELVSFLFVG